MGRCRRCDVTYSERWRNAAVPARDMCSTDVPTKSLFSPLLTLTLTSGQGVAVLLVESLAKLQPQRSAPGVLVSQSTKVSATFYCRFYFLGDLGKSGEKILLVEVSVAPSYMT